MRIVFAGTPEFAVPALAALLQTSHQVTGVYTQPDRPSGRGQQSLPSPVKQLALQHQLAVFQPQTLRDPDAQQILSDLKPDLIIVAAYGLILPKAVLEMPKYGCMNIHASLLPRWRGAAPIHRAILAGDKLTGITLMQMAEGLDTGDMLYQFVCPIEPEDNLKTLHDKLARMGAESIIKILDYLEKLKPEPQDALQATYASKVSKLEANLDWQKSAMALNRAVRAFYPAYSYLNGQLVRIWAARESTSTQQAAAGTILSASSESIDVIAGEGILSILKLQLAGGKILTAREMLNARAGLFAEGNIFYHH